MTTIRIHATYDISTGRDRIDITPEIHAQILAPAMERIATCESRGDMIVERIAALEASNRCRLDEVLDCHRRIAALESVRPAQIQANPHYDHQMQIDALGRRIVALEGRCQGMRRDIDQHAHNVDGNSTDGIYNLSRPGIDYPAPVAADKPEPLDLSTEQIAAIIAFELRHAGNEWACAAAIKGRHTRPSPAEWSQYVPATGIELIAEKEAEAAKQEAAGLRARKVKLPGAQREDGILPTITARAEAWNACLGKCADAIRAAGIEVEG